MPQNQATGDTGVLTTGDPLPDRTDSPLDSLRGELLSLSEFGVWCYDPARRGFHVDSKACAVAGLADRSFVPERDVLRMVRSRDRRSAVATFRRLLSPGGDTDQHCMVLSGSRDAAAMRVRIARKPSDTGEWLLYGTIEPKAGVPITLPALTRSEWVYGTLLRCTDRLIRADSEAQVVESICQAMTSDNVYPLAWIGKVCRDTGKTIDCTVASGRKLGYAQGIRVTWADDEFGNGPTGLAVRLGVTQVRNHLVEDPEFTPWRSRARKWGLWASLALPIRVDGQIAYVLTVYSEDDDAFGETEVGLFERLADEIGYGVEARRTREAFDESVRVQQRHAETVRALLDQTVGSLSATIELRDPYTAGHQRNVATIAVSIGRKMGLTNSQIEGLQFAGLVHDIGKMRVPVEILMKPRSLSPVEFELVKTHPQAGYEVLKDIEFPWPVAQTVLQHHEYMDGSGYPNGLRGEEILLEARIVTVSDIVDAMSSNRPYREALGMEEVLDEVRRQRGIRLDPDVVDACLELDWHETGRF